MMILKQPQQALRVIKNAVSELCNDGLYGFLKIHLSVKQNVKNITMLLIRQIRNSFAQ
jgi:hypothetical protein